MPRIITDPPNMGTVNHAMENLQHSKAVADGPVGQVLFLSVNEMTSSRD